jgi:phage shock protein A
MTQKTSILGRMSQLARANINAILDRAEDPEVMLNQLVTDFTNSIADAEEAVAQTIANTRMAEEDLRIDREASGEWGRKAAAASAKADDLRSSGDTAGADKFDTLAKLALSRQISFEREVTDAEPRIAQMNATVDELKNGLTIMHTKLEDLKNRRSQLIAGRARRGTGAGAAVDELDRRHGSDQRALALRGQDPLPGGDGAGRAEAQSTTLEDQFAELDDDGDDAEVEARLAALKNR